MTDGTASGTVALPRLTSAFQRHRVLVGVVVFAALLAGLVYSAQAPGRFSAEAVILLQPVPGNPLSVEAASGSQVQLTTAMETEAGIMRSPLVAARVADRTGKEPAAAAERVLVNVPVGTQMLRVSVTRSSAAEAADVAQAYALEYLAFREERAVAHLDSRIDRLREQADVADENLRRALDDADDAGTASFASQEVQLYADRLAQLSNAISAAEAVSTDPGQVVNPAEPPASSDGLGRWFVMLLAGLVGLLLAVAVAYLRELRRDVVRGDEELAVPTLADLSAVEADGDPGARPMGTSDGYRQLRVALTANAPHPHVVAVAGVEGGVAGGEITAMLAVSLADAGFSVAAVGANPQSGAFEASLGMANGIGLAEVLRGSATVGDATVPSNGVAAVGRGVDLLAAREMLAGPRLRALVAELRAAHDYVIVDAAAAGTGDGDAVIAAADSTLVIVVPEKTTHTQVHSVLGGLELLGAPVAGIVRVTPRDIDPFVTSTIAVLWPGSRLERPRRGSSLTYVPLPHRDRPTALVPTSPLRVASAALRRHRAAAEWQDRWAAQLRAAAARLGALHLVGGSFSVVAPDGPGSLVDHLADDLGVPVWASIHLGPPRANRKPILHMIDRSGQTQAFVKVGVNDLTRRLVVAETKALERLATVETNVLVVPKVLRAGMWGQCEYLMLAPVETESRHGIDAPQRERAMRELVSSLPVRGETLARSRWWNGLLERLRDSEIEHGRALLALADRAAALWGSTQIGMGAAHGDWTPWNMATTPEGVVVWDWERFDPCVPVGFDNLHYALQSALRDDAGHPRRAVRSVSDRAGSIVAQNGAPDERGQGLMMLYLLSIGERYTTDRQDLAGARHGDLGEWLLPELSRLTDALEADLVPAAGSNSMT